MKNVVLLIAGGTGTRVGANIPKQFIEVEGKEIIQYTMENLQRMNCVDEIYAVVIDGWEDHVRNIAYQAGITKFKGSTAGGSTRFFSMYNGILLLSQYPSDTKVCVLDANRPMVSEKAIKESFDCTNMYDASIAMDKSYDTMYISIDGTTVSEMIDRNIVYKGQTPEVSKLCTLKEVFEKAITEGSQEGVVTSLMLRYGKSVGITKGSPLAFKITTKEDIELFNAFVIAKKLNDK